MLLTGFGDAMNLCGVNPALVSNLILKPVPASRRRKAVADVMGRVPPAG